MSKIFKIAPFAFAFLSCCLCLAQAPTATAPPLVGVWHNMTEAQYPQTLLMIGAEGYYAQVAVPPGRRKPEHDFDHRTREELAKQFGGFRASWGTWKVEGNKFTRTITASEDPGAEGKEITQEFRLEGDVLVLIAANTKSESRFRRMK